MGKGLKEKGKGKSHRKGGLSREHAHTHTHTLSLYPAGSQTKGVKTIKYIKKNIHKIYKKQAYTSEHPGPRAPHPTGSKPVGTVTKANLQDPTTHMQGTRKNILKKIEKTTKHRGGQGKTETWSEAEQTNEQQDLKQDEKKKIVYMFFLFLALFRCF